MRRSMTLPMAVLLVVLALPSGGCADLAIGPAPQSVEDVYVAEPPGVRVTAWVEGLEAPWSLVFLPGGRALVSERPGRIRLIRDGVLQPEPHAVVASRARGEGGLMGLAVHPRFSEEPYVYAMHTHRGAGGTQNRVIRLRDEGRRGVFDGVLIAGIPGARNHNGGRIGFGPDGMLYVTTGEIFEGERAQDLQSLGGKILRITPEGEIPDDNPFPGSPVYAFGNRNPQGLAWQPGTGTLFASEHGPSGEFGFGAYDEINVIRPAANYGWPMAVGAPGLAPFVDPVVAWSETTTPPSGMAFWRGDLYVATLGSEALIRIRLEPAAGTYRVTRIERWFATGPAGGRLGRLRDAVTGPDGALYVLTSNRDGRGHVRPGDDRIYRLEAVE